MPKAGRLVLSIVRADVSALQADSANAFAVFQAASQFNCLEAVAPSVVPEDGISAYSSDRTQVSISGGCVVIGVCGERADRRGLFQRVLRAASQWVQLRPFATTSCPLLPPRASNKASRPPASWTPWRIFALPLVRLAHNSNTQRNTQRNTA